MNIGHTVKSIATGLPHLVTGGVPGERAGDGRLSGRQFSAAETMSISSSAFADGEMMPALYSADGQNISPPLAWTSIPAEAKSLVLIVEDPDAPTPNPFVHWLVYNMPATTRELPAAIPGEPTLTMPVEMSQGRNSALKIGYTGAAPPKGDTPHRYFFQLFALDRRLELIGGVGRSALLSAMKGHVTGKGVLVGTYQR
ncbi:MAG TPA: YbhB/YbcL family Raf kinase inhibitor-like protein [Tepidisphaeraceae bacterium]|jgi:hypothetical protein|nr:YbhB/YbcL family Raf kinase inhibitor-like protein [Tepidisphaeraceae bacterium]